MGVQPGNPARIRQGLRRTRAIRLRNDNVSPAQVLRFLSSFVQGRAIPERRCNETVTRPSLGPMNGRQMEIDGPRGHWRRGKAPESHCRRTSARLRAPMISMHQEKKDSLSVTQRLPPIRPERRGRRPVPRRQSSRWQRKRSPRARCMRSSGTDPAGARYRSPQDP